MTTSRCGPIALNEPSRAEQGNGPGPFVLAGMILVGSHGVASGVEVAGEDHPPPDTGGYRATVGN